MKIKYIGSITDIHWLDSWKDLPQYQQEKMYAAMNDYEQKCLISIYGYAHDDILENGTEFFPPPQIKERIYAGV